MEFVLEARGEFEPVVHICQFFLAAFDGEIPKKGHILSPPIVPQIHFGSPPDPFYTQHLIFSVTWKLIGISEFFQKLVKWDAGMCRRGQDAPTAIPAPTLAMFCFHTFSAHAPPFKKRLFLLFFCHRSSGLKKALNRAKLLN